MKHFSRSKVRLAGSREKTNYTSLDARQADDSRTGNLSQNYQQPEYELSNVQVQDSYRSRTSMSKNVSMEKIKEIAKGGRGAAAIVRETHDMGSIQITNVQNAIPTLKKNKAKRVVRINRKLNPDESDEMRRSLASSGHSRQQESFNSYASKEPKQRGESFEDRNMMSSYQTE